MHIEPKRIRLGSSSIGLSGSQERYTITKVSSAKKTTLVQLSEYCKYTLGEGFIEEKYICRRLDQYVLLYGYGDRVFVVTDEAVDPGFVLLQVDRPSPYTLPSGYIPEHKVNSITY